MCIGTVEQDELSTYLKKFTDVWVAYALLLIAYVEVLSLPLPPSLSLLHTAPAPLKTGVSRGVQLSPTSSTSFIPLYKKKITKKIALYN